eukprot:s89_g14.t1
MGKQKPSLLPLKLVEQHARCCRSKPGRCGLCHWHLKRSGWLKGLKDSSWAKVSVKYNVARLGCTYCALAETESPWALFEQKPLTMKPYALQRHEESETHKKAAMAFKASDKGIFAPAANEFQDALTKMAKGGSSRDGKCCSDKRTQIRWCLSEAVLSLSRERLRRAESVAIMRDERKGRLLLRYRATLDDLSVVSGVLGFLPTQGFADSIAEATQKSISDFCTPLLCRPRQFKPVSGADELDKSLLEVLLGKTEILITDAAAPELLASRILTGKRKAASASELAMALGEPFKRVKVIGRDAAHASTRLIKRPFQAHEELERLLAEFVTGKDSFAQKIQHSPLYMQWWQAAKQGDESFTDGGKNLSAAKHRFSSYFNPLSKISKNLHEMVQVCHKIATVRGDSSAAWASRLLQNFSGKKAVLLALVADAACTCQDLTRSLDQEGTDICQLNLQVQIFVASLRTLFGAKQVLRLPTYTKHVLDELRRTPIAILHGCAREVTISDRDEWAAASEIVVATEFPSWDIVASFDAFALDGAAAKIRDRPEAEKCLDKLAHVFGVNQQKLHEQFTAFLPTASALQKQAGLDNRTAWSQALNRVQERKSMRNRRPHAELRKAAVICAFLAWTNSSSGVEQLFSQLQRSPAEQASAKTDTDRRLATVMGTYSETDATEIVSRARVLYSELLVSGKARKPSGRSRLHKCQEMKQRRPSEKQWVRDRRSAVLSAASDRRNTVPNLPAIEDLPPGLQKEVAKQKDHACKRKAEAYLDGLLLPAEADGNVLAEAAKKLKTDAANDTTRRRNFQRVTTEVKLKTKKQSPAWAVKNLECPVYFAGCGAREKSQWSKKLRDLGITTVTQARTVFDLKQARMLIIPDSSKVARKYRVYSALMGATLLSGSILEEKKGLKLSHVSGFQKPVSVFCTDKFKQEQPGLVLLVREACARGRAADGGWKAVSLQEAARTAGRRSSIILHGKNEKVQVAGGWNNKKTELLTGEAFAAWVSKKYIAHGASAWVKASKA